MALLPEPQPSTGDLFQSQFRIHRYMEVDFPPQASVAQDWSKVVH
jgi:hypothetical protein